jgi:hypothetical protein
MALQSTKPVIKDGVEYPTFLVNLAISPFVHPTEVGGSVAMRLTPYRTLEDGSIEQLDDAAIPVVFMDVFKESDPSILKAAQTIMTAIQDFITEKNL